MERAWTTERERPAVGASAQRHLLLGARRRARLLERRTGRRRSAGIGPELDGVQAELLLGLGRQPGTVRRGRQNRQHSARRRHNVRDGLRGRAALRRPATALLLWAQRLGVAGDHWFRGGRAHHRLRVVDLWLGQPKRHPPSVRLCGQLHRQHGADHPRFDAGHQECALPNHMEELHELGEDAGAPARAQRNQRTAQRRRHGAPKGNHGALPQDRGQPDGGMSARFAADAHPLRDVQVLPFEH